MGILFIIIFIAIILAGVFGILHDEITYTISTEYFTKFKFIQFHVGPAVPYRLGAALVGLMATWWTGLIIGAIIGLKGLGFSNHKLMWKYGVKAMGTVFAVTIMMDFIGFLSGRFYFSKHLPDWSYYPDGLVDKANYVVVGTIHNFSYLGGFIGLIIALIFMQRDLNREKEPG